LSIGIEAKGKWNEVGIMEKKSKRGPDKKKDAIE
jgi:hypothetical protein